MTNARDLRLQSDYMHLQALAKESGGTLAIEAAQGRPPDRYVLVYKCRTIERLEKGKPVYRQMNRIEIKLPARYPAPYAAPQVKMLTPIWHPHVYKNLVVCMGEWKTSEYLDVFALRLGALLQFEKEFFDMRDPANEEAVDWARKNLLLFPTDRCTFQGDPPDREVLPSGYVPLMPTATLPTEQNSAAYAGPDAGDRRMAPVEEADDIVWQDLS